MRQIIHLDNKLKTQLIELEKKCEQLCHRLNEKYKERFNEKDKKLAIGLVREKKGEFADSNELFKENYESYIETGIEDEGEYFPDAYIPLWKCKKDWFQTVGYLNEHEPEAIEKKLEKIIQEMLEDA